MAMTGQERGLPGLTQQFLAWLHTTPRTYGDTMNAWRTSCPRLSVWEDALAEGLVEIVPGAGPQSRAVVRLTEAGAARLGTAVLVAA